MPPPDESDPAMVRGEDVPPPPVVIGAARQERQRLGRKTLTKHERELQTNDLRVKGLETDKLEAEVQQLKRRSELLEQEVSRLWWDKYTRLAACAAIFAIVGAWLWAVRQLLVLPAVERPTDAVLIAALGTTTVNVLGLLYIVARYLFPQQARAAMSDPKPPAE